MKSTVPPLTLANHRSHDVAHLLQRWRIVARQARLVVKEIYRAEKWPVFFIHSPVPTSHMLYLSAGVHGDEPAAVSGLLSWAEENSATLRQHAVAIFPLFNPAGLAANTRFDHRHIDLNRRFHDASHPHIRPWWQAVTESRFPMAVHLHEDYDAQGCYCYELNQNPRLKLADKFLDAAAPFIPRDARRTIDGGRAQNGVIQRRRIPSLPGLPEALALYMHNTDCTLTFETPSEFALTDRVAAHRAFLNAVWTRHVSEA